MDVFLKSLKGFWFFMTFYVIVFFTGDLVRRFITFDEDFTGPERYFLFPVIGSCAYIIIAFALFIFYVLGDSLPSRTKQK